MVFDSKQQMHLAFMLNAFAASSFFSLLIIDLHFLTSEVIANMFNLI